MTSLRLVGFLDEKWGEILEKILLIHRFQTKTQNKDFPIRHFKILQFRCPDLQVEIFMSDPGHRATMDFEDDATSHPRKKL